MALTMKDRITAIVLIRLAEASINRRPLTRAEWNEMLENLRLASAMSDEGLKYLHLLAGDTVLDDED